MKKKKQRHSFDSEQLRLPFDSSTGPKLFPYKGGPIVTLVELAQATEIPLHRLQRWARIGILPGGFQPQKGYRWQFERVKIEEWWEKMTA